MIVEQEPTDDLVPALLLSATLQVLSFRSIEEDMHRLVLTRFFPAHAIF